MKTKIFNYISLGDSEKDIEYIAQKDPAEHCINAGMVENLDDIPLPKMMIR